MVKVDAATRNAILDVLKEANEMYNEVYLTPQELCKQICMLTPDWLKEYGHKLPRERVEIKVDGKRRSTRWGYPLHKIQRMIAEGKLRSI